MNTKYQIHSLLQTINSLVDYEYQLTKVITNSISILLSQCPKETILIDTNVQKGYVLPDTEVIVSMIYNDEGKATATCTNGEIIPVQDFSLLDLQMLLQQIKHSIN